MKKKVILNHSVGSDENLQVNSKETTIAVKFHKNRELRYKVGKFTENYKEKMGITSL